MEQAISDDPDVDVVSRTELVGGLGTLKPWDLIHGYVERKPNLPRRTHYNLACYFAGLLEYAERDQKPRLRERALESLEVGLVGGELVEWAEADPSLAPLRDFRRNEFTDVLAARTIELHPEGEEPEDE